MQRFPASVHTDNIQQKLVGSLGFAEGLAMFGPTEVLSTADPTMHCRNDSRENTDLRSFHDNRQFEEGEGL